MICPLQLGIVQFALESIHSCLDPVVPQLFETVQVLVALWYPCYIAVPVLAFLHP